MAKNIYENDVQKRIENMWRVHRNRVDMGLGATFRASGHHEGMKQDTNFRIPNASWSLEDVIDGF